MLLDSRQVSFKRTKIGGKFQNSNATFCVIFKQCEQAAAAARYMTRFAKCNFDIRNFFCLFFFCLLFLHQNNIFTFNFKMIINHLICCRKWRTAVQSLKAKEGVTSRPRDSAVPTCDTSAICARTAAVTVAKDPITINRKLHLLCNSLLLLDLHSST